MQNLNYSGRFPNSVLKQYPSLTITKQNVITVDLTNPPPLILDYGRNTGLFISPSGISELDCATTKTDTAERSISIGRESLKVFFVLGALAYF